MCAAVCDNRGSAGGPGAAVMAQLDSVEQLMLRRYSAMLSGFAEVADKDRKFRLAYSAARDMLPILRFCIPVAAELAMFHKPEYSEDGSALYRVVMMYTLCLTEQDRAWEAMVAASENLFSTPELAEASTVFGAMLSYVILQYVLFMPYMLETMGEVWPDKAEHMLSGIVRAQHMDKASARKLLEGMHAAGLLPAMEGPDKLCSRREGRLTRLMQRLRGRILVPRCSGTVGICVKDIFRRWMGKLAATGEVELPKGQVMDADRPSETP